jgi:hypothetical protein
VILIGLGTGVHRTVSIDQLSWRYPDRIGRLLGLFDTVGTLGGVAASLAVVLATGSREWRLLFLAAAVTGFGFVGTTIARISHHSATVSGTDSPWRLASVVMVSARSAVCIYRPRFPMRSLGAGLGLVRTLLMSVSTLAPAVVGFVADLADFILAFGLLAVAATGAVLLAGLVILVDDRS